MKFGFKKVADNVKSIGWTSEKIPGDEAFKTTLRNKSSKWPSRGKSNRIEPFCAPAINAKHTLSKTDQIFTMGSCFARNIERMLIETGHNVPFANIKFPKEELWQGTSGNPALLNKYTPQSMLNELEYVFNDKYKAEDFLVEASDDLYFDYQLHTDIPVSFARGVERRKEIKKSIKDYMSNADVVILTLGLVEVWWDDHNKLYLNETPSKRIIDKHPNRFSFVTMSPLDVFDSVSKILELIKANTKDNTWIMITVSPVPLSRTFRDQDIITANMYSKSVLRVAAEIESHKSDQVEYFPSFESVMLSERSQTWEDDQIHIKISAIKKITQRVIEHYSKK